jgi:AraC-like DNA-binding protein/quercetin dioxygenase-like cupin family protein
VRQQLELPPNLTGRLWLYRNQGRRHALHRHAELEFNLVTRGSGQYLLAGRRYRLRRGDLLWLFPAQEHVLIEQTADFEMWIGVCRPGAVRAAAAGDPGARVLGRADVPGEHCRRLAERALARLEELFAEVAAAEVRPALANAGLRYALLQAWRHFEGAAGVPVTDVHPAVEKAARLIRDGGEELRRDELARRAGLSPERLGRLFRRQTGLSLVEFRNRQRVEAFLRLYGTGQRLTMLEAALEAGFGSYAQFHRSFKRATGRAPGRYRRGAG